MFEKTVLHGGLLWLRRPHEFGSPSGGHQKALPTRGLGIISDGGAASASLAVHVALSLWISLLHPSRATRCAAPAPWMRPGASPMTNSFASMTSQSIRLMRRQHMFGGTKRPNVRVAARRCLHRRCFLRDAHGALLGDQRSEVESVVCQTLRKYSHEVERPRTLSHQTTVNAMVFSVMCGLDPNHQNRTVVMTDRWCSIV